jgi:hypothetical protein
MGITRRDVVIVTLQDKQVYSKASIRENWTQLIMALAVMARANEESETKSKRSVQKWQQKRIGTQIITKMCPAWLSVVDGKFVVDEVKAAVVQRIFQMAFDGYGTPTIARMLNADNVPCMVRAKQWSFGLVARILKNDGVIGTLVAKNTVADDILNYYPQIVKTEIFNEVNKRVSTRQWKGGMNAVNVRNLLSGLCFCSGCGSALRTVGASEEHTYLRCVSAYSGGVCKAPRIPLLAVERCLMERWVTQGRMLRFNEKTAAHMAIDPLMHAQNTKEILDVKIANLTKAIEDGGGKTLVLRQAALEEERAALEVQIEALRQPQQKDSTMLSDAHNDYFQRYDEILESGDPEKIKEWRTKTQSAIRRFIRRVSFDCKEVGTLELTYVSGTVRNMDYRDYVRGRNWRATN